jgi:LmbE family N-acetylglucosaminyl deacetylase
MWFQYGSRFEQNFPFFVVLILKMKGNCPMKRKNYLLLLLFPLFSLSLFAQKPSVWTSGEIYQGLQKLNFLGSALYVAAHPDDENTRLIAYLANEVKANTAYLALTRGDGGQNLIGPEIRELLGVIRTQELLAARRTDGGNQLFTRANDFGYSKTPDETVEIWEKDEVVSDVVWAIRKWRPDVIVNRFSHDKRRRTHGHHTASAMLSFEAFDLAGDPKKYPEQLEYLEPWQPRRLFFNTSWWFYGSREAFAEADKSNMLAVDVGVYYPLLGKSNTEIAAESRSQHKCQGFGSTGSRGGQMEYLELLKGDMPEKEEIFAGINTSWTRVEGGAPIGKKVEMLLKNYDLQKPYRSVPALLEIKEMIEKLPDGYWKSVKLEECKELIEACLGLYLEGVSDEQMATPGEAVEVKLEATNRSPFSIFIKKITLLPTGESLEVEKAIGDNESYAEFLKANIPADAPLTTSYWLKEPASLGMYTVEEQLLRGKPESERYLKVRFEMEVDGKPLEYTKDVIFKRNDPVDGEVVQPFELVEPVYANLGSDVILFSNEKAQKVEVKVKATRAELSGNLRLDVPEGWQVEPKETPFSLKLKGEEKTFAFSLRPPEKDDIGEIHPVVKVDGKEYTNALYVIEYDHIPTQTIAQPSRARVVRTNLKIAGQKIGYIDGAGDIIPEALRLVGYEVDVLEDEDIRADNLAQYDAIVVGIRAYNTEERMPFYQPELLKYTENGGTLVIQYNTSFRLKIPDEEVAPFKLKLSRERVTVEEAEMRILAPDHPVLNTPNKITDADFDGWVQERGLYFPSEWGPEFTPIFSCNDPGEEPSEGSLLVAEYGKGHYIYTGLSFFRELPAGVPGAYRLFVNLVSLGAKVNGER